MHGKLKGGHFCDLICITITFTDMWLEGNPLHPQSLVPMLRQLASEHPPDLREIGLDADQVRLVLQDVLCSVRCVVSWVLYIAVKPE